MPRQLPQRVLDSVGPALDGLTPHRQELFGARLRRWWPDLVEALGAVYADAESLGTRVVGLAADAFARRDDELHGLDLTRSLEPDWFQRPDALGYAAYADRFAESLAGVGKHASYLRDLGVTYLHLMPLLLTG
ncbi:MAG: alpha-amylase, partial [Propionibacteriales bacterium]|nr:alpha-amylase [Propionibacteriales bacterium]